MHKGEKLVVANSRESKDALQAMGIPFAKICGRTVEITQVSEMGLAFSFLSGKEYHVSAKYKNALFPIVRAKNGAIKKQNSKPIKSFADL